MISSPLDRATDVELATEGLLNLRSDRVVGAFTLFEPRSGRAGRGAHAMLCGQERWCGCYRGPSSGSTLSPSPPKEPYHFCSLLAWRKCKKLWHAPYGTPITTFRHRTGSRLLGRSLSSIAHSFGAAPPRCRHVLNSSSRLSVVNKTARSK
jgi:hypothetical protein